MEAGRTIEARGCQLDDLMFQKGLNFANLKCQNEGHFINNRRMFNLGIDDLAEKPYITQKKITSMNLLQMSCVTT